jgi:hypothetical protein
MARLSRFLHLERQRSGPAEPIKGFVQQQRFDSAQPVALEAEVAQRSGAETRRFAAEPPASHEERPLRVREDDDGLPFIRCCRCRFDNPVQARVCDHCGADLTTPMQRSFNEALHERLAAERDEERQEVARLDAARVAAQQEYKEILRRGIVPYHEPRQTGVRQVHALGKAIGIWLARRVPNRRARYALLATFAVLWVVAACLEPLPVSMVTVSAIGLGMLFAGRRRASKD